MRVSSGLRGRVRGVKFPDWLYSDRTDRYGFRIRRFGSRRYGVVANHMSGDPHLSACLMATVWRFHFAAGPHDGIGEGFAGVVTRSHFWPLSGGRCIAVGWGSR